MSSKIITTSRLLTLIFIISCKEQFAKSLDYRRTRYTRSSDNDGVSPWINKEKFQGDIIGYNQDTFENLVDDMNKWQTRRQENRDNNSTFDSATSDPRGLWLNGRVPYVISSSNQILIASVKAAIEDYHKFTCLSFIPRTHEEDYIKIVDNEDGCFSALGNINDGPQILSLGPGCRTKGIVIHELMHAIGFWHEHQRIDRDDHVEVNLDNVEQKYKKQYNKAKTSQMNLIGSYDMDSIMHYRYRDFALPGKSVMKAKGSDRTTFGNEQLSPEDIRKIRELYRCNDDKGESSITSGEVYYIRVPGTSNCLDVPGQSKEEGMQLQQWDCNHSPAQKFVLNLIRDDVYTIKNIGNGKVLDVATENIDKDGGKVQQWNGVVDAKNQQFNIVKRNGNFHITSVANGKLIWVDSAGKLGHWKYDAGQNWQLEKVQTSIVPGAVYTIKDPIRNKCWDAPNQSTEDGVQLQQWDCNQSPAQKFVFNRLSDDAYTIKNAGNGKFVDTHQLELDQDCGKVIQWPREEDNKNQKFNIAERKGLFHITSVSNGKIIWANPEGKICHWKYDGGQNWKLERID